MAPKPNRHPPKHCASARGQTHTHTYTHTCASTTAFRFHWSLMWNQYSGEVSVFCNCQEKKDIRIQWLELAICQKSGETGLPGNYCHVTFAVILVLFFFPLRVVSLKDFPGLEMCCIVLRCTQKSSNQCVIAKLLLFSLSRGTHSINLYPCWGFFFSALPLSAQIAENVFLYGEFSSFTSHAHSLKAIL